MTTTSTTLRDLAGLLSGTLVLPDDDGWDAARRPWDAKVDQHPAAVVHAATIDDVTATVRFAADRGLSVAAQPRGHGATSALDGAILLRTGALDELSVDTAGRTARVGAGVAWGRVLAALDGTGLVAPAGSNAWVTAVPYLLGGGLSWFGRAHGVAASHLLSADVVGSDGVLRRVDAASDPDLLWALRGGGGDFGVVTAVEIALEPAPEIYGGRLAFADDDAAAVFRAYAAVTADAPETLTVWFARMHYPPMPEMPEEIRGKSFITVDAVYLGGADEAEALLAPVRAAGTVLRETMRPLQPSELGTVAEEPEDGPPPGVVARMLMQPLTGLDDGPSAHLVALTGRSSGLTMTGIRHLGGALSRGPRPGTVDGASVRVDAEYLVFAMGIGMTPEALAQVQESLDALRDALAPAASTSATLTFLADGAPLSAIYPAETVARLQQIKRTVDPSGVFRSNHPVLNG